MALAIKRWCSVGESCQLLSNSLQLAQERALTCRSWHLMSCIALDYNSWCSEVEEFSCKLHRRTSKSRETKYFAQGDSAGWDSEKKVLKYVCCTLEKNSIQSSLKPLAKQENTRTAQFPFKMSTWPTCSSWVQRCSQALSLPNWLIYD